MPETTRQSTRKISRTECGKREQKCKPGTGNACYFCSRGFPPIKCSLRTAVVQEPGRNMTQYTIEKSIETAKLLRWEPQGFGGYLTAAECANLASDHPAFQKPELLHFFHIVVAPSLPSIDGKITPAIWHERTLPWLLHSPLMPEMSALIALCVRNLYRGLDSSKCTDALIMRGGFYSLLKDFLSQDLSTISDSAVHALVFLEPIEELWGDSSLGDSLWAHMKGVRAILMQQGGITAIRDPTLKEFVILTDYRLACTYERDLFLHKPQTFVLKGTPAPVPYPQHFNSPLLDFSTPFQDLWAELGLSPSIASILDIVRPLTKSIVLFSQSGRSLTYSQIGAWRTQTASAYSAMLSLPGPKLADDSSELDIIYDVCRMTALAYTFAISSSSKLSSGYFANLKWRDEFHAKLGSVSLTKWQKIPGIFAWILLVYCPSAGDSKTGIYAKKKMTQTILHISIQDFDIAIGILRAFWTVQRWISSQERSWEGLGSVSDWLTYALPGLKKFEE
ncbi:hypothetical protein B0O99DRAFT_634699 [Bisporella sp. PMI_857]|nr:hypothetical protein B0O99DRAFT_634699 [Bisporella sp. PMI_857]